MLLTALRDHLVGEGIVRAPDTPGGEPPFWREPRLGTPAPGETPPNGSAVEVGADAVIGAYLTGGFAPPPYGSTLRKPIVDLRLRTRLAPTAETLELAITKALIDRRDWVMGGLYVVECEQWRALSRLTSDEQGFEYVTAYWFELVRE